MVNLGLTGSSGFIGSAMRKHFKDNNDDIIVLDNLVHPDAKASSPSVNIPDKLDWVLHFGADKSIEESFVNPIRTYRRNMHSTMSALDIAMSSNSRFLYMDSYVYGKPKYLPIDEKHPVSVRNPYMGSKLLGEQLCFQLHQCLGISALVIRGFTIYGPEQRGNQFIPSVIESVRSAKPILVKDPNPIRDYLHIDDFVRLIDIIVRSDFSGYKVYNVGGGKPHKNIEVAEMANELAGKPTTIQIEGKERKNDVPECWADIGKVARDFQWQPEIGLKAGLSNCLSLGSS